MYITQKCFEKGFYFLRFGEYEEKVLRSNSVGHWSAANHGGEYLNDFSFPFKFLVEHLQTYVLFRQNTYLQNKKHTLTCQGGTGCYRFNYQPGS